MCINWAGTSFILFLIMMWESEIISGRAERDIVARNMCACVQNVLPPIKIPHEQPHTAPLSHSAQSAICTFPKRLGICLKRQIS